jgi:glycine/D-amino acid oxidase-like deaminating enzyme
VGGFSGQGFKYAPVVGETAADLVMYGRTNDDYTLFRYARGP